MKSYCLEKSDFDFNILDQSWEFKDHVKMVFESENAIYFVLKGNIGSTSFIKKHMKKYYKNKGWSKIKFLCND